MMNDSTRVMRRPRRAWPPAARTAAAIIATAALALLAAACGGSPSSAGSGGSPDGGASASSPSAVAYSSCLRSHGVPNYPDPGSGGAIPKGSPQQLGVSNSQFQTAQSACHYLLPNTGGSFQQQDQQCVSAGDCPPALVQRMLASGRTFAACMRSHGVPNWPDPSIDTGAYQGVPFFDLSKEGINDHLPQIRSKMVECGRLTGGPPVPEG
jgi:hypothetical protein